MYCIIFVLYLREDFGWQNENGLPLDKFNPILKSHAEFNYINYYMITRVTFDNIQCRL